MTRGLRAKLKTQTLLVAAVGILIVGILFLAQIKDTKSESIASFSSKYERGYIVLKGSESGPSEGKYVALPNGLCNLTIGADRGDLYIAEAKAFNQVRHEQYCNLEFSPYGCNVQVGIDDEYYMIRLRGISANMQLNYNCLKPGYAIPSGMS